MRRVGLHVLSTTDDLLVLQCPTRRIMLDCTGRHCYDVGSRACQWLRPEDVVQELER